MAVTRIGVYGGTFDPVHMGHLAVVEAVREEAGLDRVLFVPNHQQPLKASGPLASDDQRLRMLRAAVAGNPGFGVSDLELRRGGPSYTIETLDALRAGLPSATLCFILGSDAARLLAAWQEPVRILTDYHPLVMTRAGWPDPDWEELARLHPDARQLVRLIDVPRLEIASSDIRARIAAGRSIRYLVPEGVRQIIEEEGIFGWGKRLDG